MIQYQSNYWLMPSQPRLVEKMLAEHVQARPRRNFSCHKFNAEKKERINKPEIEKIINQITLIQTS